MRKEYAFAKKPRKHKIVSKITLLSGMLPAFLKAEAT